VVTPRISMGWVVEQKSNRDEKATGGNLDSHLLSGESRVSVGYE
jgi:hypothetical protein